MTQPEPPDEEALAFEALVVREVAGEALSTLDDVIAAILAAYEGTLVTLGDVTEDAAKVLGRVLADRIRALSWTSMRQRSKDMGTQARMRGVSRAIRTLPPGERERALGFRYNFAPTGLPNFDRNLRRDLNEAATIAAQGIRTRTQAATVASKVKRARNNLEGSARWLANDGMNAGVADVAKRLGKRLLWTPERNACLHCLAYAGWIVEPDDPFPVGRSFDPRGSKLPGVHWPPLHPNCRCEVRMTEEPAGPPPKDMSSVTRAGALAREARRTVVYQWTDYASPTATQAAAEALLKAGAGLPASVEKRARAALRKGGAKRPK